MDGFMVIIMERELFQDRLQFSSVNWSSVTKYDTSTKSEILHFLDLWWPQINFYRVFDWAHMK